MGPLLGGALSQVWGWRSTFIALTVFAGLTGLVIVALIRKETHQFFVLKKLAARDPDHAKGLQEWEGVTSHPPVFSAPWVPLRWVVAELVCCAVQCAIQFVCAG
jgi:predicted MFS family arabinose efflux permease